MAKTSDGTRDQPVYASSGNTPDFASDLTDQATFFAARSLRRFSTVALLLASSGSAVDDYAVATNAPGALFRNTGAGWQMFGTPRFADSAARATALAAPVLGMRSILTSDETTYRYNGSTWKAWESDWITYTPTLGANITLGTGGTVTGKYQWVNGSPRWKAEIVLGTGGTVGGSAAGNTITLPPVTIAALRHAYQTLKGSVMFADVSVGTNYQGGLFTENLSTTVARIVYRSGPESNISATVPFGAAFAIGDCIEIDVMLEVA